MMFCFIQLKKHCPAQHYLFIGFPDTKVGCEGTAAPESTYHTINSTLFDTHVWFVTIKYCSNFIHDYLCISLRVTYIIFWLPAVIYLQSL